MRRLSFCLAAFLFSFAFFSCSDSEADVVSVSATAVFDFADEQSAPSSRLAVFFQVSNEVQRTESFTVRNEDSGYVWSVPKPGIFSGMNKSYAYSVSLTPPEGASLPVGSYSVTYYDAAGNEDQTNFTVNYKNELVSAKSGEVKDLIPNSIENVAIYDDAGELIFMGNAKNTWKSNSDILREYKVAFTKRICYLTPGNTVICMMPEEKLKESKEEND